MAMEPNYCGNSFKYQGREFFRNSTLHGVRYIAEKKRPFKERVFWVVNVIVAISLTTFIMLKFWYRFLNNSTIIGLDVDFTRFKVPFPAVSVCDDYPLNQEHVNNFLKSNNIDSFKNKTNYYYDFFNVIVTLSYFNIEKLKKYVNDSTLPQSDFKQIISKVVYNVDDIFHDCSFKGSAVNCSELFFPTVTENGVCYVFNLNKSALNWPGSEQWNIKYQNQQIFLALDTFLMKFTKDFPKSIPSYIYLHDLDHPVHYNTPKSLKWTGLNTHLMFTELYAYTAPSARQLWIMQRHCAFPDEIKLKNFPQYYFHTCVQQCRIDRALHLCNCIPFFYNVDLRVCTLKEMECIIDNLKVITNTRSCQCYLGCSTINYYVEKILTEDNEDSHQANSSELTIRFVHWPIIRFKREVKFGWIDLLVSFGSVAGLLSGFSILSGLEIIYYFTIRACCLVYLNSHGLQQLEKIDRKNQFRRQEAFGGSNLKRNVQFSDDTNLKNKVHPFITNRRYPKEAWSVPQPPFSIEFLP